MLVDEIDERDRHDGLEPSSVAAMHADWMATSSTTAGLAEDMVLDEITTDASIGGTRPLARLLTHTPDAIPNDTSIVPTEQVKMLDGQSK